MPDKQASVVVGVDGSPSSIAAIDYAAALAVRHQAPLQLIHGYQHPMYSYNQIGLPYPGNISDDAARAEIQDTLRSLAERVRADYPQLPSLEARVLNGGASHVLIEQSRDALVTVVGCRGIGGFTELLLGSVSWQLASHAHGPVIVLRPPIPDETIQPGPEQPRPRPRPLGPVLVGYDGSLAADAALDFAAKEALRRKAQLIVAHVYTGPDEPAEQLLVDAVKPWATDYAGPAIELRPIYSQQPEHALLEASRNAALTVVGSRGRGGFAGLLLGSVSRTLVHHGYGPLAVIHPAEHVSSQTAKS